MLITTTFDVCPARWNVAATAFEPGGDRERITVSIGIAALSPARAARGSLMAAADAALYRAKNEGRNLVRVQD